MKIYLTQISFVVYLFISVAQANHCRELFLKGDLDEAKNICMSVAESSKKQSNDYIWAKLILFDISEYQSQKENSYKHLLDLSKLKLKDALNYELLRRKGHYYFHQKKIEYAQSYYKAALSIANKLNNKKMMAKSYNDIGLMHLKENHYKESLENLKRSLKFKEELNDKVLVRTTLTNIGLLYYRTGDFQESLNFYNKAEEILNFLKLENKHSKTIESQTIHLYSYMSAAYEKLGKLASSQYYSTLLEKGISELDSKQEKMNRSINLVEILIESKNYALAAKVLQKANKEYKDDSHNNSKFYYQLAKIEFHLANIALAKLYAEKSLAHLLQYGDKHLRSDVYLLLSKIEEVRRDYIRSLSWLRQHYSIKVNDIESQVSRDFKNLKYEHSLDSARVAVAEEKLNTLMLKEKSYRLLMVFLIIISVLLMLFSWFYHQRKILKKDILRHKEVLATFQKAPINFHHLFKGVTFPVLIVDETKKVVYSNFLLELDSYKKLDDVIKASELELVMNSELDFIEAIDIKDGETTVDALSKCTYANMKKVFSKEYCIFSFFRQETECSLSFQINVMSQLEYHLHHYNPKDIAYLRRLIVECMNYCLTLWKKTMSMNKVEFADRSKIWKINIDEGRLRTRSLDRYLSMDTIPKNPRVMQVIKTCHYLLTLERLNLKERAAIEKYLIGLEEFLKK